MPTPYARCMPIHILCMHVPLRVQAWAGPWEGAAHLGVRLSGSPAGTTTNMQVDTFHTFHCSCFPPFTISEGRWDLDAAVKGRQQGWSRGWGGITEEVAGTKPHDSRKGPTLAPCSLCLVSRHRSQSLSFWWFLGICIFSQFLSVGITA